MSDEKDSGENSSNAEFESKFNDINDRLEMMNQQTQKSINQIAEALLATQQHKQATYQQPVEEDFYSLNPAEYKARIKQEVLSEVEGLTKKQQQEQFELQKTLHALQVDYPEIADLSTPVAKRVLAIHNALPPALRDTAVGYETAVLKATRELGVMPKNQRAATDNVNIKGQGRAPAAPKSKGKEKVVQPNTFILAKLMAEQDGRQISDEELMQSLQQVVEKRGDWGKYE